MMCLGLLSQPPYHHRALCNTFAHLRRPLRWRRPHGRERVALILTRLAIELLFGIMNEGRGGGMRGQIDKNTAEQQYRKTLKRGHPYVCITRSSPRRYQPKAETTHHSERRTHSMMCRAIGKKIFFQTLTRRQNRPHRPPPAGQQAPPSTSTRRV